MEGDNSKDDLQAQSETKAAEPTKAKNKKPAERPQSCYPIDDTREEWEAFAARCIW